LEKAKDIEAGRERRMEKIPEILAQIEEKEVILEKRAQLRKVKKAEKKLMTPRFGARVEYVEPLPAVAFKAQIAKSFKNNKSLVNPLYERYQSLMRTGKVFTDSLRPRQHARQKKVMIRHSVKAEGLMTHAEAGQILRNLEK